MSNRSERRVALRAYSGQFVCAEGGGGRDLVADRDAQGAWETFAMLDRGGGNVALRADSGQHVCAENNGANNLTANRAQIAEWETFALVDLGGGKVALKACNGQYVRAVDGGGGPLIADRTTVGPHETFSLVEALPNRRVRLKASNGKYLCAESGGGGVLNANRDVALQYETFTLVDRGYGKVALQTWSGKFVQAVNGGSGGQIGAAPDVADIWETFDLIDRGSGKIALRGCNGRYVSSEDGKVAVTVNRMNIGDWETFTLEEAALSWESLGQTTLGTPSIVSGGPGRLDVFIRGIDEALWTRTRLNGVWGEWTKLGHKLTSDPVAVSWGPNHIDVFFRGPNGENQHVYWLGGSYSDVLDLGGKTNAAPGVTSRGQGKISAFHRGMDGRLYVKSYQNGSWEGNWYGVGGVLGSGPAATTTGEDNRLDVFVRGMDDGLWHFFYTDTTNWGLQRIPRGTINSAPTVLSPGSNRFTVLARQWDGALYSLDYDGRQGPGWQSWVRLGDGVTSPASAVILDGMTYLVARGADGAVLLARLDGARWPVASSVAASLPAQTVTLAQTSTFAVTESILPSTGLTATPDRSNWMASIPGITEKTLRDICVPRAHDCGTYSFTSTPSPDLEPPFLTYVYPSMNIDWVVGQVTADVPSVVRAIAYQFLKAVMTPLQLVLNSRVRDVVSGWGRAHGNTILQQLQGGVRWLDLRVCSVNGELRTHHGLTGPLISSVLDDVRTFVQSTSGEVIVIEVHTSLSGPSYSELIDLIVGKLDTYLYPYTTGAQLGAVQLGAMTDNGARSRVAVYLDNHAEPARQAHPSGGKLWSSDGVKIDGSTNGDNETPDKVMSRQRSYLAGYLPVASNILDMDWTYSPSMYDMIASAGEVFLATLRVPPFPLLPLYKLEHMALALNFTLAEFVKSLPRSSLEKINRINVDFADRSPATDIAIALSKRDFDAINAMSWSDTLASVLSTLRDDVLGSLRRMFDVLGVAGLIKEAAEIVIGFCKTIPDLAGDVAKTTQLALSWGLGKASAAFGLAAQYCISPAAATRFVTDNAQEAAAILKDTFQRPAEEVYHVLQSMYGASEDAAKAVLGGVGYAADEIEDIANKVGNWFKSLF